MRWFSLLALVTLLLGTAASGIQVVYQTQEVRRLHVELQSVQRAQDELLSEYTRLLLERGTLASYQNVERLAVQELSMMFPESVERVEP
ncbi:MAG TPA: cell division protein FtsL [Gammaproteobacteria bacterium]|nr:cell division protein FtsL [Gammaproteobacteria bacterium]